MGFTETTYNVCIKLSETWKLTLQFLEDDGVTPIDLTGRTAQVQVRSAAASTEVLLDITHGDGLTFTAATGLVEINADTTDITTPGEYVWALELDGSENEEPVSGRFKVTQDVVRPVV